MTALKNRNEEPVLVRKKTYSSGRNVNFLEISKLVMKRNNPTEDGGQKLTLADRALKETHIRLRL